VSPFTTEARSTQRINEITKEVIGAAIEVHRALGPGLWESAYEECLCRELLSRHVTLDRQVCLPLEYKGVRLDCGYRLDLVVAGSVVVEVKAAEQIAAVHEAQLLTYMKLARCRIGLLINFHVPLLKNGVRRLIIDL
jgi:GxxExxY protein